MFKFSLRVYIIINIYIYVCTYAYIDRSEVISGFIVHSLIEPFFRLFISLSPAFAGGIYFHPSSFSLDSKRVDFFFFFNFIQGDGGKDAVD